MQNHFTCPKCGELLHISGRSLICDNKHCFDIAKEGYVNLHITNKKSELIGDNKLMVSARKNFLNLGHYFKLAKKLSELCNSYIKEGIILDCGCGNGYYSNIIKDNLNENISLIGIDISKEAIKLAAKENKDIEYAVASAYELPLSDKSVDLIISVFAPYALDEMKRVLKDDGRIIFVSPNRYHLWELKQAIYGESVYEKDFNIAFENFQIVDEIKLTYDFILQSEVDVDNLITMTPYCYKTPKELLKKAKTIVGQNIKADFLINVVKKA